MQTLRLVAVLALALVIGQVILIRGQSPQPTGGNTDELVKEIRLIRLFLESSQKETARREVLLERYRLENDIVTSITDRLESIRDQLATAESEIAKASTRMEELQTSASTVSNDDLEHKAQLQAQINESQLVLQDLKSHHIQLLGQESRLSTSLHTEEGTLQVLNSALEAVLQH
jgi:archaellum component FlaC